MVKTINWYKRGNHSVSVAGAQIRGDDIEMTVALDTSYGDNSVCQDVPISFVKEIIVALCLAISEVPEEAKEYIEI